MPVTDQENEREYKVLDQLLSGHSKLRDRYQRLSFSLSIGLLGGSIVLCAFVFAGDEVFQWFGWTPGDARNGLGVCSVVLLLLSVVEFRVNWAGKAEVHRRAVERLGPLKSRYRRYYCEKGSEEWAVQKGELNRSFQRVTIGLPEIPENVFNKVKAHHAYKRILSMEIDKFPETPLWLLRIRVRLRGLRNGFSFVNGDAKPRQ